MSRTSISTSQPEVSCDFFDADPKDQQICSTSVLKFHSKSAYTALSFTQAKGLEDDAPTWKGGDFTALKAWTQRTVTRPEPAVAVPRSNSPQLSTGCCQAWLQLNLLIHMNGIGLYFIVSIRLDCMKHPEAGLQLDPRAFARCTPAPSNRSLARKPGHPKASPVT